MGTYSDIGSIQKMSFPIIENRVDSSRLEVSSGDVLQVVNEVIKLYLKK